MAATTALNVGNKTYQIYSFNGLDQAKLAKLPFSMKILLENLMRHEDGVNVTQADIDAVLNWNPTAEPSHEIAYMPARVVMQDFTGVPCIVDLAAMRDAVIDLGGDPKKVNPQIPAELVIDHSVMVDHFGTHDAIEKNAQVEFERNEERYRFLRWGQLAFDGFKVVPPDTGIVHQVNVEYLARTVFVNKDGVAYPDTVVGTDSHTTMVNGIGVLGWGVGGIEAEAAMLGQPSTMLIPHVIGFKLTGKLSEGVTTTDLVLTVTQMLRTRGVVEKFVEFFGPGLKDLPLADRATIANMAPEYGATCGIFPIDGETIRYLKLTGREPTQLDLVEAYAKAQGLWREDNAPDAHYTDILELDMGTVQPSLAGPKRPQDRVLLTDMKTTYEKSVAPFVAERAAAGTGTGVAVLNQDGKSVEMKDGAVVITAITSCTNTSNPAVLIAAGLVARKARALGLNIQPWVKPSLAPGSKVVNDYLTKAGLLEDLEALKFHIVGYGCTTCIGNSGPLPEAVSKAIVEGNLNVASVLSGNRNFEGRVHAEVRMNFLASPPLVVAYAIAGTVNIDLHKDSLGKGTNGQDVYLKDIWPSNLEVQNTIESCLSEEMFRASYADVFAGDHRWQGLEVPTGDTYAWDEKSSYVANPPYFVGMSKEAPGIKPINGARCLAVLGDSITTDHISPAGNIKKDSPGGAYLMSKGVKPIDFNSYGSRRGHHEVMMRGTFANIRIRNQMTPSVEGGVTAYQPTGEIMPIYDAAMKYQADGIPLVILAGKEYGTGSSRDWAAKGTMLQGVKAVITESFERIHRSNLVGMGVLPLVFTDGQNAASLGLDGSEVFGISEFGVGTKSVTVTATKTDGSVVNFTAKVRVDTPKEWEYFTHGGILPYVLRGMIG